MKHTQVTDLWHWFNQERVLYPALALLFVGSLILVIVQRNAPISCSAGFVSCISTKGKLIPAIEALQLEAHCQDFVQNEIGAVMLRRTLAEILEDNEASQRGGRGFSALFKAHYAFDQLYDSRISFDRASSDPIQRYQSLKSACAQLGRDIKSQS
jgi:hypothetical protein